MPIPSGTVLNPNAVTSAVIPTKGLTLVGVTVSYAKLPAEPLRAGDMVRIVDTPRDQDDSPVQGPITSKRRLFPPLSSRRHRKPLWTCWCRRMRRHGYQLAQRHDVSRSCSTPERSSQMFVVLASATGAPGVSTTALGLALSCENSGVLYVEADPVGGSPLHIGYFKGAMRRGPRSLINLVEPARHGKIGESFRAQSLNIPETNVWAVPGLRTASQADSMATTWGPLGAHLRAIDRRGATVVVDGGRLGHRSGPHDLITQSDLILVVTRTSPTALGSLKGVLDQLRAQLRAVRSPAAIGLVVIEDKYYSASENRQGAWRRRRLYSA